MPLLNGGCWVTMHQASMVKDGQFLNAIGTMGMREEMCGTLYSMQ
jgi:hypothetical protein